MKSKNRIKMFMLCCFVVILCLQIACITINVPEKDAGKSSPKTDESTVEKVWKDLTKPNFPSPREADLEQEKAEAKKLVASGIEFTVKRSSHGMREARGMSFGTNEIESSDGVKVTRDGKLYETPERVKAVFDESSKLASKIFEKTTLDSKRGGQKTDKFIGVAGNGDAVIVYTSGYYLYQISSPSLRHLLAFEEEESHFFDYK